jgi:hypothetical protein
MVLLIEKEAEELGNYIREWGDDEGLRGFSEFELYFT